MLIKNCRILIDGVEKVTDILTAEWENNRDIGKYSRRKIRGSRC